MRTLLATAMLVAHAVGAAADPPKLDEKAAAVKIKKLRDLTAGEDAKPYPADAWEKARNKNPDLLKAASDFDAVTDGLSKVDEAAQKLAKMIGQDPGKQGAEAKRFLDLISEDRVRPNRAIESGDKLLKKVIPYAPVGVVGEESDGNFRLSAEEFTKNSKKAHARLKARYEAMKANADRLKGAAEALDQIAKRAVGNKKLVDSAAKNAEDFVQRGDIKAVNTESVRKHIDGKRLSKLYDDITDEAGKQLKAVKRVADAQKKQLDAYKKLVGDAREGFGLDL